MKTPISLLPLLAATALTPAQDACQLQRLISPPHVDSTDFGAGIQTNGTHWIIADARAQTLCAGDPFRCTTGAVFAYELVGDELVYTQTILPADLALYDNFGVSIWMDGNRLAVGSLYTRREGTSLRHGAVYIYEHDGESWVETDKIEPPLHVWGEFGNGVRLWKDDLFVTPQSSREFFWYKHTNDGWVLYQTVSGRDLSVGNAFAVGAVHDAWVVASDAFYDRLVTQGGALFFYRRDAGGFLELVQQISATELMRLGADLRFDGDTLLVGAPAATRSVVGQGVVQVYGYDGRAWTLREEIVSSDPGEFHAFGLPIAIDGDTLLVTAWADRSAFTLSTIHHFRRAPNGGWINVGTVDPDVTVGIGHIGSPTVSGGLVLIGARSEPGTGTTGAAYFFDLNCGGCTPDLDADGTLTIFDFLTFLNLFDNGDMLADFDGDGELTVFDLRAFQTAFDAGCP